MILHIVTLLPAIQISRCLQITCILIVNNETAAMYPFPRFARRFLSQYVQETKNYVCVSSFIAASKALSYIFPHYFRGHTGLSVRGVFLP